MLDGTGPKFGLGLHKSLWERIMRKRLPAQKLVLKYASEQIFILLNLATLLELLKAPPTHVHKIEKILPPSMCKKSRGK